MSKANNDSKGGLEVSEHRNLADEAEDGFENETRLKLSQTQPEVRLWRKYPFGKEKNWGMPSYGW